MRENARGSLPKLAFRGCCQPGKVSQPTTVGCRRVALIKNANGPALADLSDASPGAGPGLTLNHACRPTRPLAAMLPQQPLHRAQAHPVLPSQPMLGHASPETI